MSLEEPYEEQRDQFVEHFTDQRQELEDKTTDSDI